MRATPRPTGSLAMSASAELFTTPAQGGQARLACVAPALVAEIWPHVAHLIRRAMARGRMGRFADVEADVRGGNAYLWLAVEKPGPARASDHEGASRASPTCGGSLIAAAVTKVTQDDGGRLCTIVACAGHDWKKFGPLIAGL